MSCSVDLYEHPDRGGAKMTLTATDDELNGPVYINRASSYEVNGCENTVVTACRAQLWIDNGSDCRYLRGYESNLDYREKYNDDNWDNDIDGVRFTPVPTEDANNFEYNRINHHYTPASPDDDWCGGCRLWPQVKDKSNPSNANLDNVWMGSDHPVGYAGVRPCPGGNGYFTSGSGIKCIYSKTDQSQLNNLYEGKGTNSELIAMHTNLKSRFCAITGNAFKNPGGGSCLEYQGGLEIAKQYCSESNRISSNTECSVANLGETYYRQIAETYCKTPAGIADDWCSCYNVVTDVCDTNSAAAGCETKRLTFDKLVEKTPDKYKSLWVGRAACIGGVCQNTKYIPTNANQNCGSSINICNQEFTMSNVTESDVDATCTINSGNGPSVNDGNPPPPPPPPPPGGGGIGSYIPKSLEDLKTNRNQQIGLGGGLGVVGICVCGICIILLLLMSGGGGGGGGPTRFRRR